MNAFFSRTLLTLGVLALLGGCSTTGQMYKSWFGGHVQDADEAPVPDASPATPVESQPLGPQSAVPNANQQQVAMVNPPQATQAGAPQKPIMAPPAQQGVPASALGASPYVQPSAAHAHTKVGILLPLSGKNAPLGKAMLNAAQMAVFDMSGGNFELMPRDTGATDASAAAAARDAISSGAQLLIGPLFATQVASVREVAANSGVNILTLSTDTSLAAPGIFVMGFAPGAQVERVISYTVSQGVKRFAALVPDNTYGQLVGQTFQLAVARSGGVVVDIQNYNPAQHGAGKAITALAAKQDQIEAIFLPEGDGDLEKIAGQLATAGFDNHRLKLLGTGLWDEPDLGQRVAFLVGGWYAASDPAARSGFMAAYARAYGQEPPRLATLSYDATALAAVLARRGLPFDRAALTNPNGFAGVDGIFRLTLQGLVERGLAINEVTIEGDHAVSAAPATFAGTAR